MKYEIILYYKYTPVENPKLLTEEQKRICAKLSLKGRVIVASEGINGTLEGTEENIEKYCNDLKSHSGFEDIIFKKDLSDGKSFPKLKVKFRDEIVSSHLGSDDVKPYELTGKRISPDELEGWRKEGKEFYVIDMRNDYEYKVGRFENSINPQMQNFRDLPIATENLKTKFKDKTIVTVCTGGVRCEKASGYLLSKGFEDVYQLDGGIVTYMKKYPDQGFKGKLYVFDNRIVTDYDKDSHTVVGECDMCGSQTEQYVNCKRPECNRHFLICDACKAEKDGFCGEDCRNLVNIQ